jgi:hypothetical protein
LCLCLCLCLCIACRIFEFNRAESNSYTFHRMLFGMICSLIRIWNDNHVDKFFNVCTKSVGVPDILRKHHVKPYAKQFWKLTGLKIRSTASWYGFQFDGYQSEMGTRRSVTISARMRKGNPMPLKSFPRSSQWIFVNDRPCLVRRWGRMATRFHVSWSCWSHFLKV